MRLSTALSEKIMDIRLRDKLIAEGKITKAEVDKMLASLPDDSDKLVLTGESEEQRVESFTSGSDSEGSAE